MAEIRFTRKAVEDLSDIWNYTADMWSERQADTYYRLLIASCRKLAGNPVLFGREYKELGADIFGFKVNKHIVFYRRSCVYFTNGWTLATDSQIRKY